MQGKSYKHGSRTTQSRAFGSSFHSLRFSPVHLCFVLALTMLLHHFLALVFCATTNAAGLHKRANSSSPWYLERFANFIVFGDSYTDENRLNYFASHNGSAPPPGTYLPEVSSSPTLAVL